MAKSTHFFSLGLCTAALLSVLAKASSGSACDEGAVCSECSGAVRDEVALLQHRSELSSAQTAGSKALPGCSCETFNMAWTKTNRTDAQCVFIDLGANNGNTLESFLQGHYFNLSDCPNNKWEAFLVEANPRFAEPLQNISRSDPNNVHALCPQAAFYCEGQTHFFLDEVNQKRSYWGSSMSEKHGDVVRSGGKSVEVETVNVARILHEKTLPEDVVIVKMDIEGSEWDIVPCLARSESAKLMDRFFCEEHRIDWSSSGKASQSDFHEAKQALRELGVKVPTYHSDML